MKAFRVLTALALALCILFGMSCVATAKTSYKDYSAKIDRADSGSVAAEINIADYIASQMEVSLAEHYGGRSGISVITGTSGEISWSFNVEKAGAYCLGIDYFPIESKNADIKVGIKIDGEYPFAEAESVTFKKLYKNKTDEKSFDNRGNEILPEKVQVSRLISDYARSWLGDIAEPYYFMLSAGTHTLTFVAETDKMAISKLFFSTPDEIPDYSEYIASFDGKADNAKEDFKQYIQAEDVVYTTSSMMIAKNDRSSPLTMPNDAYNVLYNTFGGSSWSRAGEYATWNFTVPEDGFYNIGIKFRQNNSNAILPVRKFYIDDAVLFDELTNVSFPHSRHWQYMKLSGGKEDARIYLTAGEHTLKIESVLGSFSESFEKIDNMVYELNSNYRKIIMITGASPDVYRDYQLSVKIPDVIESLDKIHGELTDVMNVLDKNKIGNSEMVELATIRDQIAEFVEDPETIPERLESFKTNTGALSDWCVTAKQQSVEFDYFVVCGEKAKTDRVKANIFEKIALEFKALVSSFINDYNTIGNSYGYEDSITVWIMTGRDQANTLKSLIDSDFMVKNTIDVDLKLVTSASVLSALIAGKGPDVALGLANGDPVNYAIRNAVIDLSKLEGFNETVSQFYPSAVEPFTLGAGVYAIPETQVFPVMFYRKDVLEDLKLDIPKTWDDVATCLTELTNVNMEFGLSSADSASTMNSMGMFLYQNGGTFYIDDNKKSGLTTEVALNSFKQLTNIYNSYRLPYSFSDLNRFRSGEMPLIISSYALYNTLCVSAPEITGLWGVTLVPGTVREDGTIDHSVMGTCTGTSITTTAKNVDAAWKFIRWWTSAETQSAYGMRIEGLLGQSARYATANVAALENLPWSEEELSMLRAQHEYVKAIPETPGSYFTPRHLYNAFRRVITYGDDPRQTMIDYTEYINREITSKRKEFGLS